MVGTAEIRVPLEQKLKTINSENLNDAITSLQKLDTNKIDQVINALRQKQGAAIETSWSRFTTTRSLGVSWFISRLPFDITTNTGFLFTTHFTS